MMRADGHAVSTSAVERALRRRGLLLPRGFRADHKSWAALRRKVFHDPPTERNRVWQTEFSEFEIIGGDIWRICAVIDYATKYCLAITIASTGRGSDALACLRGAVTEAERIHGLDDLRDDRGELELVDENTGEIIDVVAAPIAVVSDNGSCFRGETHQTAFAGDDPLLRHVRSPQSNGVIERFFGTLKYEHLVSHTDRRRRRAGHGDRPVPRHLQPHPTSPVDRRPHSPDGLSRLIVTVPLKAPMRESPSGGATGTTFPGPSRRTPQDSPPSQ